MISVIVAFAERGLSVCFTLLAISLLGTVVSAIEVLLSEIPEMSKPVSTSSPKATPGLTSHHISLYYCVFSYSPQPSNHIPTQSSKSGEGNTSLSIATSSTAGRLESTALCKAGLISEGFTTLSP